MTSIKTALKQVRLAYGAKFNELLARMDLPPLSYDTCPPDVNNQTMMMGIYLSSPEGKVCESRSDGSLVAYVTLDCVLDTGREEQVEDYLNAAFEFAFQCRFGMSSMPTEAISVRTELGSSYNGFCLLIECNLGVLMDAEVEYKPKFQ